MTIRVTHEHGQFYAVARGQWVADLTGVKRGRVAGAGPSRLAAVRDLLGLLDALLAESPEDAITTHTKGSLTG